MEIIKDIAATQEVEWGTLADAIDRNFDEASTGIQTVAQKVDLLDMASPNYCVGEWQNGELSPTSVNTIGDTSILDKWDFYLIDTTDNTGETNHPVGKLKRNNLLRFVDGSFAPVIGITEAMRAECDVELYLDIRLQFTDQDDPDSFMTSDDFTVQVNSVFRQYDMTIYAGDLEQQRVKAELTVGADTEQYSAAVGSGTLTIRGVTDLDTATTPVVNEPPTNEVNSITAHIPADAALYINESRLEVADPDAVHLLVD